MPPPPPPPPPRKNVGGDSADAFFNDFQRNTTTTTSSSTGTVTSIRQPRPPGGNGGGGVAPPRLPAASAGRGQQQQLRNPVVTTKQPTSRPSIPVVVPQQQTSNSYYNNSSNYGTTPTAVPPPQPAPVVYQNPLPTSTESPANDWYTPSTTDMSSTSMSNHNNDYGMVQPQQQHQYQQFAQQMSAPAATTTPYNTTYTNPSPSYFNGPMDTSGRDGTTSYPVPQTFVPQQQLQHPQPGGDLSDYGGGSYMNDITNEPPLLEELGVNWEHIMMKTKAVVVPFRRFQKHSALADPSIIVEDADLAGPLVFALLLGGELLITGKLQFGYIYGFGLFGCLAMTLILNLMSTTSISFWTVTSILGYALIPVNILAVLKIVLFSFGTLVQLLALFTVIWSTTASTRLLEIGFGLTDQRYLLAYPIALLYSAFVLITIF